MPKISVIVPMYNLEKYLRKSLDSLISQSLIDIEIILVDDGSKDNTLNIAKEYELKDKRIILISKENGGVDTARNIALENASGDYIAFFDADDIMHKYMLEKIYIKAITDKCDLVVCGFKTIFLNKKIELTYINQNKNININTINNRSKVIGDFLEGKSKYSYVVWNKLFKRKLIEKNSIRFKSHAEIFGDDLFFIVEVLFKVNNIGIVNEILYEYRRRPNSIMTSYISDRYIKLKKLENCIEKNLKKEDLYEEVKKSFGIVCFGHYVDSMVAEKYSKHTLKEKYTSMRTMSKDKVLRKKHIGNIHEHNHYKRKILYILFKLHMSNVLFLVIMLFASSNESI